MGIIHRHEYNDMDNGGERFDKSSHTLKNCIEYSIPIQTTAKAKDEGFEAFLEKQTS